MLILELSSLMPNTGKEQRKFVPVDVIATKVTLWRWKSAERLTLLHQPECPGNGEKIMFQLNKRVLD